MKPTWQTEDGRVRLWRGDCRVVAESWPDGCVDAAIVDPPYGVTSLDWDVRVDEWPELCHRVVNARGSMWVFGSLASYRGLDLPNWKISHDIVWEKHNGSNFHADRFRRVHELAMHLYRGKWEDVYKEPQYTNDATKRTVRRKQRPPQMGDIGGHKYVSHDGGPRLMRSVLRRRSCHGEAVHPTQKPVSLIEPLITYCCPPDGIVLSPFMGSGSDGVAAIRLGRRFWGVEIEPKYFDIAVDRVKAELNRFPLFEEPVRAATQQTLELEGG